MSELDNLKARVLAWREANDGGHLHPKWYPQHNPDEIGPQLCVSWDHGGYHEIAGFYSGKSARDDVTMICEVFNWAVEQLTPSAQSFYGERTYDDIHDAAWEDDE